MSPEELERRREAWLDKADDERIARPARLRQERRAQNWAFLFSMLGLAGFIYIVVMILHL
jgi:hypothetical protein